MEIKIKWSSIILHVTKTYIDFLYATETFDRFFVLFQKVLNIILDNKINSLLSLIKVSLEIKLIKT